MTGSTDRRGLVTPFVAGVAIVSGRGAVVLADVLRRQWPKARENYLDELASAADPLVTAIKLAAEAQVALEKEHSRETAQPHEPTTEPASDSWLSTEAAAGLLKISDRAVRDMAEELAGRKVRGRFWEFPKQAVEAEAAKRGL